MIFSEKVCRYAFGKKGHCEKDMINLGYYNGKIAPLEELTIPANDRSNYYGDGVYDVVFGRNRKMFALNEHIARFFNSCRMLKISPNISEDELKALFASLLEKVDSDEFCLYWHMTRGTALRGHAFPEGTSPNLLVTIRPHHLLDNSSKRLKLLSVEDNRYYFCNIKTINLIPNVLAAEASKEAGCDEAVFVRNGYVTEGSHSNIAILKDGVFVTAPLTNLILPGVTRAHGIALCREKGIPVQERSFSLAEMEDADEIFVMASSLQGVAVSHLNGKPVGGKAPELCETIRAAYRHKFLRETEA